MPRYKTRTRTEYAVVHWIASDPEWHGNVDIDEVRKWHTDIGYIDVGYHVYIPFSGVIQLGRPLHTVGAHEETVNDISVGIALEGGATAVTGINEETGERDLVRLDPNPDFTEDQYRALQAILASFAVTYPGIKMVGHMDLDPHKSDPGFDVAEWWELHKPPELIGQEEDGMIGEEIDSE